MLPLLDTPLARLEPRDPAGHKGSYGRALLVGGSRGMSGAPALAGLAALRGGAGLVEVATPASVADIVAAYEASYLTAPLPDDAEGRLSADALEVVRGLAARATSVGVGPGLGQSEALGESVSALYRELPQPAVFDADALNLLARSPGAFDAAPAGLRILTPHPGEFARLIGRTLAGSEAREAADAFALRSGAVVVLKGNRTYITDGRQAAENPTGNPGMGTGGTGDVLTGLIVALVCQGLSAFDAARSGAYVHGLAGDLAAAELGEVSLIASDVARHLPGAIRRWLK